MLDLLRTGRTAEAQRLQTQALALADRIERLTNELVHRAEAEAADSIDSSRQADARSRAVVLGFAAASIALALLSAQPRPGDQRSLRAIGSRGSGSRRAISRSTCAWIIGTSWGALAPTSTHERPARSPL